MDVEGGILIFGNREKNLLKIIMSANLRNVRQSSVGQDLQRYELLLVSFTPLKLGAVQIK